MYKRCPCSVLHTNTTKDFLDNNPYLLLVSNIQDRSPVRVLLQLITERSTDSDPFPSHYIFHKRKRQGDAFGAKCRDAWARCRRFRKNGEVAELDEAITLYRSALELRPHGENVSDRIRSLHHLALCLSYRYIARGLVEDLEEAITLGRAALKLCTSRQLDRATSYHNLACDLRRRFANKAETRDLEESIELHRSALELRPLGHPRRCSSLHQLALCLSDRYDRRKEVTDLEEAVMHGREALKLSLLDHPDRGVSLFILAHALRKRFQTRLTACDLDEAIALSRAALELCPSGHARQSSLLHHLAACLSDRCGDQKEVSALDEVVTLRREVLKLHPPEHADRGKSLRCLAFDLRKRFEKQDTMCDLEEAIKLYHAALTLCPEGHPDRSSTISELFDCVSKGGDKLREVADLETSILLGRLDLDRYPSEHANRGVLLHNLGRDLRKRFTQEGAICDLEESIKLLRLALELRPTSHPDRSSTLHELAVCLSNRHDKLGVVGDLEQAITFGGEALDLCQPESHERRGVLYDLSCYLSKKIQEQADIPKLANTDFLHQAVSVDNPTRRVDAASPLLELSQHLWHRFQKRSLVTDRETDSKTDLDDAICLATYALELRLPREDVSIRAWVQRLAQVGANSEESVILDRAVGDLCTLANYYRARFQTEDTITDLDEAITLYRYVSQLCPTGHPNRASWLHDFAQCLADLFHRQPAAVNLDEAIALQQEVLPLLVSNDPGYDVSLHFLADCVQMKVRRQITGPSSDASPVTASSIDQDILKVALETLRNIPTRLLHTHTGTLCNKDAQMSHFRSSRQYKELVSLCEKCGPDQRMEHIRTVVPKYFQFVTFSHRWGEREPLLHDIEGHSIYGMSAVGGWGKLQALCVVACKQHCLWAWSDTCCIDKYSSAEVQETIGSMFVWYRQSALTIVYLADVHDNTSLRSSEWFSRGWTLQELLAPSRVLFYTQNWSPYRNLQSLNHKTDAAMLEELRAATGIDHRFLTDFSPGTNDARSRLQWASSRRTTRPEDIAYSLFGIFNVHLPVMYGESAEHALGRLLAEIVSKSGDISILDWVGVPSPFHSCFPAHITSYGRLPTPLHSRNAEEKSLAINQETASAEVIQLGKPDLRASSEVYDLRSLTKVPLPRFLNRLLLLPCIPYPVMEIQLKEAGSSTRGYTYNIQASGLTRLEIALPTELKDVRKSQTILHLVRPWHSQLLGSTSELDVVADEQLLSTFNKPFNALLLIQLPHNEHRRIASSTPITARPIEANILESEIVIFNIV
ncbi:hypothetical protein EDC04DRAFT_2602066 [Pisolithus marmoratus]|nr:hypothetical protein EDC04DRAFT_2602066 [Pisolithus marmoratus]